MVVNHCRRCGTTIPWGKLCALCYTLCGNCGDPSTHHTASYLSFCARCWEYYYESIPRHDMKIRHPYLVCSTCGLILWVQNTTTNALLVECAIHNGSLFHGPS